MAKKDLPNLKDVSRIPEELIPVVQWWQEKGPKTLGYVAAVVIAVLLGTFWYERTQAKQDDAIVAYATLPQQGQDTESSREDTTTMIIDSGAKMAPMARLDRAHALYTTANSTADFEEALADYDAILATLDDPAVKDIAAFGRICTLEALKQYDAALEALTALEVSLQETHKHYLSTQITCAKARLLCQKGDKDAAKATLATLLTSDEEAVKERAEKTLKMIESYDPNAVIELPEPVAPVLPEVAPVAEEIAAEVPVETPAATETVTETVEVVAPETPAEVSPAMPEAPAETPAPEQK